MPRPATVPSNTAAELFPDTFASAQITLTPTDPLLRARVFEPYPLALGMKTTVTEIGIAANAIGLVPPLDVIVAAPSGKHTRRVHTEIPLAITLFANEGGQHRVTVREQAHNRWYGSIVVDVIGEPSR